MTAPSVRPRAAMMMKKTEATTSETQTAVSLNVTNATESADERSSLESQIKREREVGASSARTGNDATDPKATVGSLTDQDGVEQENRTPHPPVEESDELRRLHEKAKEDPYDPFVPNDLLQHWQRRALTDQRRRLERERAEAEERLRMQAEREREELLERDGDVDTYIEREVRRRGGGSAGGGGGGFGRGRGRGVSNLPAWLVEKQRKEQESRLGKKPKV